MAGNHADALDATQEALITIARRLDRFDGRSAFSTWAYRVATNACLDELRRRQRRPRPVDPDGSLAEEAVVAARRPIDPSAAVAERLDIDDALARLPEEFRVAVVLRDVLTLDYREIAEVTGVPIGTVRSRIARGRGLLARHLHDGGNQDAPGGRPTTQTERPQTERPPGST